MSIKRRIALSISIYLDLFTTLLNPTGTLKEENFDSKESEEAE